MDHKSDIAAAVARGTHVDARIVKSRAALARALIALIGEQPFADITIAALVERAGVGYATFFRHYPGKEALLAEIADALIADLMTRMLPFFGAGDGQAAVRALVDRVDEDRALCAALLGGAGEAMRQTITERAVAQSLAAPDLSPRWLPRELAVVHLTGATLTILGWWLAQAEPMPADGVARLLYRLVIAPAMGEGS